MIANTTTTMLRSGVARTCSLQPILLRSGTTSTTSSSSSSTSPYSTFPSSPFFARSKLLSSPATATTGKPNSILILRASQQQPQTTTPSRRHASNSPKTNDDTITASSSAHAEDAAAAARSAQRATEAAALSGAPPLDWETFFKLRKSRRRLQVGFSVVTSLVSATLGGGVLGSGLADPLTSQLPLDPYMTMGLFTTGFLALGWLAGPSLGSTVFYLMNRKYKVPMTAVSVFFLHASCG